MHKKKGRHRLYSKALFPAFMKASQQKSAVYLLKGKRFCGIIGNGVCFLIFRARTGSLAACR